MSKVACRRVVTGIDDAERALTVEIADGRITAVRDGIEPDAQLLDGCLVPGYVDTHSHGAAGADFTDPDPAKVARAIEHHRRHGSTTLFASTVTAPMDTVVEQIIRLRAVVDADELQGIHIEGPFLAEERKGAHPTELLMDPTPEAIEQIIAASGGAGASGGAVKMITLAPERGNGFGAVRRLCEAGIIPAFGHSDADAETTRRAIAEGMNVATHLFNAMRPIHHREPGPVPVLLNDASVHVELICDGVHLNPDIVRLAIESAGQDRVLLVTDAMSATGCADGRYQLGALPVEVSQGTARIVNPDGSAGAIAGSTLTMDRAFAFVVRCGYGMVTASRLASSNPARVHGLAEVGTVEPGKWADLCLVDEAGELRSVMRRGQWLEQP
ncbi:N-acetylglucosamine-6-phosphate deacetylase [Luteococcus sp. H138]|uniref:N-acetylglucosamine-6-phosphate deacetylase n=1 Tax=unclassified Luteococcus TaxID=2639923 RepID=UPI00313D6DA5